MPGLIVIADAGATKTEWRAVPSDGASRAWRCHKGDGINLSVMSPQAVREVMGRAAQAVLGEGETAEAVFFYCAGMISQELSQMARGMLEQCFPGAAVSCWSDLVAAARALWGDAPGIAAILGTGSNSCLYDGSLVVENVPSGGFIIGDEGGGAALGKMLLADFVKGLLPEEVSRMMKEEFGLSYSLIVKEVYSSQTPSRYLASFAPFVLRHAPEFGCLQGMIEENFRMFVRRCLLHYNVHKYKVGVVGGVGCAGRETLDKVAAEYGVEISMYLQSPTEALAEYHLKSYV